MSLMQPFQCVKSKYNYFVNQFAVLQKTLLLLLRAVNPNTMTGNHLPWSEGGRFASTFYIELGDTLFRIITLLVEMETMLGNTYFVQLESDVSSSSC